MIRIAGRLALAAAMTLLFAHAAHAGRASSADALYTTGSRLYSDGDYDEAEKYFAKAVEKDKRHTSAMFMLGETISLDVRRLTEAEEWYKKALASQRADKSVTPRVLLSLGKLYILLGREEDALASFRRIISEYPDFYEMAEVYNHMGVATYRLDRYDRALANFKAALKIDTGLMEATFNMKNVQNKLAILNNARYQQRMGNNEAAIKHYEDALSRYPNYVAAWYQVGLLYLGEGNYDLALKHLERARALNHGYLASNEIPYRIAGAYEGRGGQGDAETALEMYTSMEGYKDSSLKAGELYAAKGDLGRAEELFKGLTGDKTDRLTKAEANYQLGLVYLKKGDKEKAVGFFQRALAAAPESEKYKNPPVGPIEPLPVQEEDETEESGMDGEGMGDYY